MERESDDRVANDLAALSVAAERLKDLEDSARAAKVAELRAKFKAGGMRVDEKSLASKLVDSHLEPPGSKQSYY